LPRDSNGNYSLPNGTLVNSGDTILPSQHNPAMSDLGQALSGSLSRDGLGGMRAPLFMGGFRVTNLADGANDSDAATVGQLTSAFPVGAVIDYAGLLAPSGWLLCGGQAVSRTTYADLFSAIGTTYGSGDGTSTFNLPDLRGRVVAGRDDMATPSAARLSNISSTVVGASGGSQSHALTTGELASHAHTATTDAAGIHQHFGAVGLSYGGSWIGGAGFEDGQGAPDWQAGIMATAGEHTHTLTTATTGSGAAHNNIQPTMIMNKIIRAGV